MARLATLLVATAALAACDRPGADAPPGNAAAPAEAAVFAKLKRMLPAARLRSHIEAFEAEVEALAQAGESDDRLALQGAAHKIVSEAGTLGLARLSARAAAVEQACRDNCGLDTALDRFREAAGDSRDLLGPRIDRKAG